MHFSEKQRKLIESIAKINNIARVSIWLFDKDRESISSDKIYSLKENTFLPGLTLKKADFCNYFKALELDRDIVADDAQSNPSTSEFTETYLKPLGISSMLDIPIRVYDQVVGVICHEHIGEKRIWTDTEKLFALTIADILGLTIETEDKEQIYNSLKQSEQRYGLASTALPIVFWTTDKNLLITSSRGKGLNDLGLEADAIVGKTIVDFFGTDNNNISKVSHLSALNGKSVNYEYKFNETIFQVYLEPLRDIHNEITGCIGLAINITERRESDIIIQERELQLRTLFDAIADIIFVIDVNKDGTYEFSSVNQAFINSTGLTPTQIIGKKATEIFKQPKLEFILERYETAIKERKTVSWEDTTDYPKGKLTGIVSIAPLYDSEENCIQLIGSVKDITERKQIETELQKNEERFRSLAEKTNIIPWTTDAGMSKLDYVGPQAEAVLGYPVEKWYEKDFWPNHIHPEDKYRTIKEAVENQIGDTSYDHEYRMISADGRVVWFRDVVSIEKVAEGKNMLRGYLIDITSQKLADEKIQKLNTDLEERVQVRTSQLMEINRELEKAKTSAEESKAAKELFLANMSHEIRTPLNAIIGFQQLLKESTLDEEQREFVESIDFASRNLLVIINDILDLSKIEAGKFQFDEGEFDIGDTIRSVIELVDLRAKEKNLKIIISQDPTIPNALYFDATRLSQILLNLVGNAIKFTETGEVNISTHLLEENEDTVLCEFMVKDTGIGISQDMISSIFERFTQESIETTRKYGGTGLGLTISRYLVEMQGGTIHARSKKGEGSEFLFQLRLKKVLHRKAASELKKAEINGFTEPTRKLNILLAEDVLLNQRLVVKIMEKWNHNLDIADNGKIAVEKVKTNIYDLILMDIQMPEMDGYQATTIIRSIPDERIHAIPIVALTAHASSAEAEKCINLGMNSYISKPFSQQKLLQIINELIAK